MEDGTRFLEHVGKEVTLIGVCYIWPFSNEVRMHVNPLHNPPFGQAVRIQSLAPIAPECDKQQIRATGKLGLRYFFEKPVNAQGEPRQLYGPKKGKEFVIDKAIVEVIPPRDK